MLARAFYRPLATMRPLRFSVPLVRHNSSVPSDSESRPSGAMMNVLSTPVGAATVSSIGGSTFTVRNMVHTGGIVIVNGTVLLWDTPQFGIDAANAFTDFKGAAEPVGSVFDGWTPDAFRLFELVHPTPEILVVGTGATMHLMPPHLRKYINGLGLQIEIMSTRHAASTYNLLIQEGRKVAAALLPVVPTSSRTGFPLVSVQSGPRPQ